MKHMDQYIPPVWIMCLESVAHLLVMLNFSSNFLIYCSVSKQFKQALSRVCLFFCWPPSPPCLILESSDLDPHNLQMPPRQLQLSSCTLVMEMVDLPVEEDFQQENCENISSEVETRSNYGHSKSSPFQTRVFIMQQCLYL